MQSTLLGQKGQALSLDCVFDFCVWECILYFISGSSPGAFTWITALNLSLELWQTVDVIHLPRILNFFVNCFVGRWLPEGRWLALSLAMGGQAASVKRRATLPMAAQKAAILTSPMLGLKPGRQPHIIHVYAEDVALYCMMVKEIHLGHVKTVTKP